MDIKPDAIALRNADFYKSNDITVKTDCEVSTFEPCHSKTNIMVLRPAWMRIRAV
jgi:hypothetical protein